MNRTPQVNVDDPTPVVMGHLRHRTRDDNAGVAEHDVDAAQPSESFVCEMNDVTQIPHVAGDSMRVVSLSAKPRHGFVQRGRIDVAQHHPGAATGELNGGSQPDAAAAAGDDRSASLESVHEPEPYFSASGLNRQGDAGAAATGCAGIAAKGQSRGKVLCDTSSVATVREGLVGNTD